MADALCVGLQFGAFGSIISSMEAIYRLNTREMGIDFVNSIKTAYPDQNVEIMIREQDETEYLMSSPANRERLNRSMQEIEEGNIITFKTVEEARQSAEKWAAEN